LKTSTFHITGAFYNKNGDVHILEYIPKQEKHPLERMRPKHGISIA